MKKDTTSTNECLSDDKTQLSRKSVRDDHIQLADIVKSFHYHLQRRMSFERGDMSNQQEDEEERWSRLMREEGERMKTYATAMHDMATKYWDSHQEEKEDELDLPTSSTTTTTTTTTTNNNNNNNNNNFTSFTADANGDADITITSTTSILDSVSPKRQRTEKTNCADQQRSSGLETSQYNDRVGYSLQCVADYYLGLCQPILQTTEQGKLQEGKSSPTNGDDLSLKDVDKGSYLLGKNIRIFERIPRIATVAVKSWRRAYYATHGHQASACEVEAAAYQVLCNWGKSFWEESSIKVTSDSLNQQSTLTTCDHNGLRGLAATQAARYMLMTRDEVHRRYQRSMDTSLQSSLSLPPSLQVLDVGSCYGPFKGKTITNKVLRVPLTVTALDLCPYESSDVIQADWLAVEFYDLVKEECNDSNSTETDQNTKMENPLKLFQIKEEMNEKNSLSTRRLFLARGQYDAVFFCLMLSFLPHPRLRYRACLHAHLALKEGGLLVIVSTRTQGARRSSWIDDWITCIEGIGFKRVHKNIMEQIVGLSFRKEVTTASEGSASVWLESMMSRPEAERGLRIVGDDYS